MRKFRNKGKIMLAFSVICLLLVAVVWGVGVKMASTGTANNAGKTKTLPMRSTSTQYPNFKGLYQFTASNSSANSNSPYLAGTYLGYYWSQLEPQKGQYNWNIIDQGMAPWISHGKKIVLRVSTAGYTHWLPPYSGHGTPQWVYDLGVSSVTETDGSVLPQYWNPIFLQNFHDFIHALAQRYDGSPGTAFIEIGLGIGGEAKVDSHNGNPDQLTLWKNIGYTDPLWWGAVQSIITSYTSSFTKTSLAVMPDKVFMEKTKGYTASMLLNYAVQHDLWLQDNGLWSGRTLSPQFMAVPHPEEQSQAASSSGDTLQSDIQRALDLGANYILIFSSDLNNPTNRGTLQWAASKIANH
jgi:hypothetical protein